MKGPATGPGLAVIHTYVPRRGVMLRQFTMKVDDRLIMAAKAHAARRGLSVSEMIRDLLMRELGLKGRTEMLVDEMPDAEIKLRLRRYGEGKTRRRDAMLGLGMDPSDVQAFARLMNAHGIAWPALDRQAAEEGAVHLLAAMQETSGDDAE